MSIGIFLIARYPTTIRVRAITATACGFLNEALIKPFIVFHPRRYPARSSPDLALADSGHVGNMTCCASMPAYPTPRSGHLKDHTISDLAHARSIVDHGPGGEGT